MRRYKLKINSSGAINFPHHNDDLQDVTMDDTSHSVYLAAPAGTWHAYGGNTGNGGSCSGAILGAFKHLACNNLDTTFSSRIRCVSRLQVDVP